MATDVILPALGMAQESGKIIHWLKAEGAQVVQGEPLVEIETDKATVEIEAPASGLLARITAAAGDDVPVGQVIALILAPGETAPSSMPGRPQSAASVGQQRETPALEATPVRIADLESVALPASPVAEPNGTGARPPVVAASLLASRIASEHHVDLSQVRSAGQRVQKADVLAYLRQQRPAGGGRLLPASPKARRLAREQGRDLATIVGTGPGGAVRTADLLAAQVAQLAPPAPAAASSASAHTTDNQAVGTIWRIMAERTAQSWHEAPHFYLGREVHADRLIAWRERLKTTRDAPEVTYTDLLVKIVALALRRHPRVNVSWQAGTLIRRDEIHVGLAVAVDEGLVVPVIHQADRRSLRAIAQERTELVARARAGRLRLQDLSEGTFTISNLGMYGVDAFNAIINQPQAAILAVGRIAERVVPVAGQPAVRPMMALTLSCDHRALDGVRGAQFLETIVELIEEPLGLLDEI